MKNITRKYWFQSLAGLPESQVQQAAEDVVQEWKLVHRQLPKAGLGLLQIRDGALGENFYLGEYPLATAHIELQNEQGKGFAGAAVVMADDTARAVSIAICDAVYTHRLPGWEKIGQLVEEGIAMRQREKNIRKGMLLRTKVDFSLLETADEEPGEEHGE